MCKDSKAPLARKVLPVLAESQARPDRKALLVPRVLRAMQVRKVLPDRQDNVEIPARRGRLVLQGQRHQQRIWQLQDYAFCRGPRPAAKEKF